MDFKQILLEEKQKPYFIDLMNFVNERYEQGIVYPSKENLFACFDACPLNEVKVVILGQDPYHQVNQAMGLSFSVPKGIKIPPSLVNIYKELESDLGITPCTHGNLMSWAKQGVLLMNTVLSVEDSSPNIHKNKGWEIFTDRIMEVLNESDTPIVFILWGKPAQLKAKKIDETKHLCLKSVHPSPLSSYRGFFGSKPFSQANKFLQEHGLSPIKWRIIDEI